MTAGDPFVLALDLGSSSVRAVVLDAGLVPRPHAAARQEARIWQDASGAAELDAEQYLAAAIDCVDELAAAGYLRDVNTIAISTQWHSLMPLDEHSRPSGPCLSWMDVRPTADRGPAGPSDPAAFHARTGAWWHPLYWPVRIGWLRSVPRVSGRYWVGLPEYLLLRLTDELGASVSSASGTGALDTLTCTWDAEALALAGVAEPEVPPILPDEWDGRLSEEYLRRWPDLSDARVSPPVGDGAASAVGSGCTGPDRLSVTVGTSAAVRLVTDGAPEVPEPVWRYRLDHQRSVLGVAYSGGGVLEEWVTRVLRTEQVTPAALDRLAPGGHGLVSLPYHAGHRPPLPPAGAGGTLHGLRLATGPVDVVAATLEGLCHELADGALALDPAGQAVPMLGGGAIAASPWLARRLTAAIGRAAERVTDAEVGARGAAAVATGASFQPGTEPVPADPTEVTAMAAAAARHRALRDRLAD